MSAPVSNSRAAFLELLETLREALDRFAGPEWGISTPEDEAGALRLIANLLEGGLVGHFDDDPRQPVFRQIVTSTRKSLGDNADAIYFDAPVSSEHAYRVRGRMAGAVYVSFTIEAGGAGGAFPKRTAGVLNDSQFDLDEEGRFELFLGGPERDRNWIALAPDASRVTTRHYFEQVRSPAVPPIPDFALDIELVEPSAPLPPPSDDSVADGLRRVRDVRALALSRPAETWRDRATGIRLTGAECVSPTHSARRPRPRGRRRLLQHGCLPSRARGSPRRQGALARLPLRQRVAMEQAPTDLRLCTPAGLSQ